MVAATPFDLDRLFEGDEPFVSRAKNLWLYQEFSGFKGFLEENYSFKVRKLSAFAWGYNNIHFSLSTNKGKFTARVSQREKDPGDLEFESLCAEFFSSRGIPVKEQIKTKDGLDYIRSRKGYTLQVFTFLEGGRPFPFKPSYLITSGTLLSDLHASGQDFPWDDLSRRAYGNRDFSLSTLAFDIRRRLERSSEIPGDLARKLSLPSFIREALDVLVLVERLEEHRFPVGFIHGDYNPGNLTFFKGKAAGVFDFETSKRGPLLWDAAFAIVHWSFNLNRLKVGTVEKLFLSGYRRALAGIEIANLRLLEELVVIERISSSIYYFDNYQNDTAWLSEMGYFLKKFRQFQYLSQSQSPLRPV